MTWACGDRYEGNFVNDRQKGEGVMYYSSDYGPHKYYSAFEYVPSKPGSITAGLDRFEPLGIAPVDAVEADGGSTAGGLSHADELPEGDLRVASIAEREHRQRFPADRHPNRYGDNSAYVGDDASIASLGMESVTGGGGGGGSVYGQQTRNGASNALIILVPPNHTGSLAPSLGAPSEVSSAAHLYVVCLSVCLFVCLSVCLSVCLPVCYSVILLIFLLSLCFWCLSH
jgi:hypothetical protein